MADEPDPKQLWLSLKANDAGLITSAQLFEALKSWVENPQVPLTQCLNENENENADTDITLKLDSWAASSPSLSDGVDGSPPTLPLLTPAKSPTPAATDLRSKIVGNYKLLQKLGEGGMGAVWMAEQERPVRRRVALKLIKAGLDDQQVLARFDAERQALAMMDHPNIARVLDAGTTDAGQPFFVMELVPGIPLTEYCDNNRLSLNERLELFHEICLAIQHAHQKGIIHRDLKPSNILVTLHDGKPVPKVIDFGLAKALQQQTKLSERTLFTEFGQVVGTLRYMSPEQAELNALDVDTRADIYSLGVILYELLTGSTPLEKEFVASQPVFKVLDAIRAKDAPRPSTRLSSSNHEAIAGISEQRQIDSRKFQKILRGELDWIVMKALEKDRSRRYATAVDFASDLQRYLSGEAVQARPPSAAYRVRKFVVRHRGVLIAATLTLGSLATGLIGIGWFWAEARGARLETTSANNSRNLVLEQKEQLEQLNAELVEEKAKLGELNAELVEQTAKLGEQTAKLEEKRKEAEDARQVAVAAERERRQVAEKAVAASAEAQHRQHELTKQYESLFFSSLAEPLPVADTADAGSLVKNSARRLYSAAMQYQEKGDSSTGAVEATFVCGIINLGFPEQAKKILNDATAARRNLDSKISWRLSVWCNDAAQVLVRARQYALAEPLLLESFETQRKNSKGSLADKNAMEATQDQLIDLYGKLNRPEDQAKWQSKKLSPPAQP